MRGKVRIPGGVAVIVASVMAMLPATTLAAPVHTGPWWSMGGQNLGNTRDNRSVHQLGPAEAARLSIKWTATTHGSVSATPAVVDGAVYFPDWGGFISKLNAADGRTIWSFKLSDLTGIASEVSRTSPVVAGNAVYLGDQNGAHLFKLDARTGKLIWMRQLDTATSAVLTGSPIVSGSIVYQGVSSLQEGIALSPSFACCTFRGSVDAVDARTGQLLWKTYTVPENGGAVGGYSGGSVWSSPALDRQTNTLYVTTGNDYTVPPSVSQCRAANPTAVCAAPNDYDDSVLALNAMTGAVKWSFGASPGTDTWNGSCVTAPGNPSCPNPGPDADFGAGPNLFTIHRHGARPETVVGAGQKSGIYWLLDARTGHVLWSNKPGPGSLKGGIMWGTATDGKRVYVAEADGFKAPYTLPDGQTITVGSWAAIDAVTGKTVWQIPDPSGGSDIAPVSTADGVVYVGSQSGNMYALDGASGKVLFGFKGPGSSNDGPAIVGRSVYWGNGYTNPLFPGFTPSTVFYAFSTGGG